MRLQDKSNAYRRQTEEAIDYIEMCARKNIVPLLHDVNVMRQRFNVLDKTKVKR